MGNRTMLDHPEIAEVLGMLRSIQVMDMTGGHNNRVVKRRASDAEAALRRTLSRVPQPGEQDG